MEWNGRRTGSGISQNLRPQWAEVALRIYCAADNFQHTQNDHSHAYITGRHRPQGKRGFECYLQFILWCCMQWVIPVLFNNYCVPTKCVTPRDNRNGWLGVKHQKLLTCILIQWQLSTFFRFVSILLKVSFLSLCLWCKIYWLRQRMEFIWPGARHATGISICELVWDLQEFFFFGGIWTCWYFGKFLDF